MPQNFGALGMTFTVIRGLQAISLVVIIGIAANFIQEMNSANQSPHKVLIGTLSVTCISLLYIGISFILYLDAMLPFLISSSIDLALLIALVVVAVTTGKPLSYLKCENLPARGGATSSFISSMGSNMTKVNYFVWAGANKSTCYEMKAIWGLAISLCILFAVSATVSGCMWKRQRAVESQGKVIEDAA